MVKSKSTTASSSVAVLFLAACTSDVVVHQVVGASYDLQVHTCAEITKVASLPFDGGVVAKFCTADQEECVTSLLAAPLAAGASQADTFAADSDYTFTVSLGNGVSTMELSTTTESWCIDQLSLGPTGGTLEQLETTPVFLDNPCDADETLYEGVACAESLQYDIAPAVSSTTADLYSLTITTCAISFSDSSAIPSLLACGEIDDCYEVLLYELFAEEAPGRVVNGELDVGETTEWRVWLETPPSELRLSHFGQLGDPDDAWCFSEITFESPDGGTVLPVSTGDSWLDAPCLSDVDYAGGCQLEYVFDLTGAAALTPAPSTLQATEDMLTTTPTTTAADTEEPSPAPITSSITPAPATTATDNEESPAPTTSSPEAADSAETVPAPTTGDTAEDVTDQDTSSAADGRYAPVTACMASSLFVAVVAMFLG